MGHPQPLWAAVPAPHHSLCKDLPPDIQPKSSLPPEPTDQSPPSRYPSLTSHLLGYGEPHRTHTSPAAPWARRRMKGRSRYTIRMVYVCPGFSQGYRGEKPRQHKIHFLAQTTCQKYHWFSLFCLYLIKYHSRVDTSGGAWANSQHNSNSYTRINRRSRLWKSRICLYLEMPHYM